MSMRTKRTPRKRSGRVGCENVRDSAQGELPLTALDAKIHKALDAELGAVVAKSPGPLEQSRESESVLTETDAASAQLVVAVRTAPLEGATEVLAETIPPMPVRRLQNYAYCPRLFYYQWVENLFEENADTV